MPSREFWKKVYAGAHFGCLVSWFAMGVGPPMAAGSAPPGMRFRAAVIVCAIIFVFALICALIGNISHRKSH